MELKHDYFAYNNEIQPRKSIMDNFNEARQQLKIVRKNECINLSTGTKDLIKIAFETIVFYEGSKMKEQRTAWKDIDFTKKFNKLLENSKLNQIVNMTAL